MELTQLKYFKAVADTGKLVKAAELLYVSASALSSSISQLEKELGVPLFDREGNRMVLNLQGQLFLHYTNQVMDTLASAKIGLKRKATKCSHFVSYAATTPWIWSEMLQAFSKAHPEFTLNGVRISPDLLGQDLTVTPYTFLFAEKGDVPASLRSTMYGRALLLDRPMIVLPVTHPLANRQSLKLEEITNLPIYLPPQGSSLFNRFQTLLQTHTLQQRGPLSWPFCVHDSHEEQICYDYVSSGIGLTFTSERSQLHNYPNVCHVPLSNSHRPWIEALFWLADAPLNEDEIIFRDFVLRWFAADRKEVQAATGKRKPPVAQAEEESVSDS